MAKTHTIHARHIICAKLKSEWEQPANANLVPLKGEFCLEINDTELAKQNPDLNEVFKLKVGDGTSKYSELPYLFTTKTEIINLITAEIDKLDVAAYAQASYNSNTKQLTIYGIQENDGKISADSTTNIVTVDLSPSAIAPIQSVVGDGTWIDATLSGTTVTVSHKKPDAESADSATATSGTAPGWEGNVITDVVIDKMGHVTGVTTGALPANPNTHYSSKNIVGGSVSATTNAQVQSDPYLNHIENDGTTNTVTSHHQIKGDSKITVSSDASGNINIDHDNTTRSDTESSSTAGVGDRVVTGVTSDNQGHITGITTEPLANQNTDYTTLTNGTTTAKISSDTGLTITGSAGKFNISDGTHNFDVNVNPVSAPGASGSTPSTLNQIMVSDGDNTTSASGVTITTTAPSDQSDDTTVPTSAAIHTAITTALTYVVRYQGTLSGVIGSDPNKNYLSTITGQQAGWEYVVDTDFTVNSTAASTYHVAAGDYEIGDRFLWDGSKWGVVTGENQVDPENPTLDWDTESLVATVDGTEINVTLPSNPVEDLNVTEVSLNGNEHITSISETDGKINVSKATIQSASTTQSGITQFVTDIHYSNDETKTANAKQIWDECEKRNVQFVKGGVIPIPQPYSEETFINSFAYGIKWRHDTSTVYSVGNSEYIRTMPVHNSLKACVYKINYVSGGFDVSETIDGTTYTIHYGARREFLYWLDDNDWSKKADGTASVLDGTGDTGIAIYHPVFYGKSFTQTENGQTWHYVYISPIKYDDTWDTIKEGYTDFAKATIVDGKARCYSGILPSVSTTRMRMNDCALASGGHQMSYDEYKWLFCWLPVIDFKTFEVESNTTPSTWSWGSDIVDRDSLTGSSIPTYGYPMLHSGSTLGYNYITSGYTNALGTHTGWVKYTSASYTANVLPVVRWRGFEIQRCNWTNVQGCWGEQTSSTDTIFATKNRALFSAYKNPNGYNAPYSEWGCIVAQSAPTTELDVTAQITKETWALDSTDGLWKSTTYQVKDKNIRYVGDQVGGWINEFALNSCGDIVANNTSASTKYDYSYTYATMTPGYYNNPRYLVFGGDATGGSNGGPGCLFSHYMASDASDYIAFRVCWNIDEYTSVMN